jgi:hypothetical protein
VGADLGYNGRAEGHVGHKMAVHDVDLHVSVACRTSQKSVSRTWSQSAPWEIVSEHALPNAPKSADRIDGAMMAGGDMTGGSGESAVCGVRCAVCIGDLVERQW